MHELTASEAATILAVLTRDPELQSSDLARLGLPPSTFYAARRKIYGAGWLTDRYLPDPWGSGIVAIDFALVSPPPSERARIEREWSGSPSNVLLWAGPNVLFGVFYRRDGVRPPAAQGAVVTVTPDAGSIPVYFDYSRSWSRFIRVDGETGYPRAVGFDPLQGARDPSSAVSRLLLQDLEGGNGPAPAHVWHSPAGLTRYERSLLDRGKVQSRTFLDLDVLPPYESRVLGEIVFLTGELRKGSSATDVLGVLNNDCQVSPVLMAGDGRALLLCALGQVGVGTQRRTKIPRAAMHVADALDSSLDHLRMTIERTDSVRRVVDHRYDRVLVSGGV